MGCGLILRARYIACNHRVLYSRIISASNDALRVRARARPSASCINLRLIRKLASPSTREKYRYFPQKSGTVLVLVPLTTRLGRIAPPAAGRRRTAVSDVGPPSGRGWARARFPAHRLCNTAQIRARWPGQLYIGNRHY